MLYFVSQLLQGYLSVLNVVHYVSFRTIAALLSTLFLSIGFGGFFIRRFGRSMRSQAREWTPERHKAKNNMPTMGGIFILITVFINALLWCDLSQGAVWAFLACILGFGLIGLWDDISKIRRQGGMSARCKFILQCLVAGLVAEYLYCASIVDPILVFPFFKSAQPYLGLFFIPWAIFVLVGQLSQSQEYRPKKPTLLLGSNRTREAH